ncbi:MAG: hypothetical protein GF414_04365 [Candidatus Altiarchaeales archaeon]|nr:hypothetical protein [Candidatus Altiarchaeales archaeon]
MRLTVFLIAVLLLTGTLGVGCDGLDDGTPAPTPTDGGHPTVAPTPTPQATATPDGGGVPGTKYCLTPENTVSVVADEYHVEGTRDAHAYHTGEWLGTSETYGFLADFDIPELRDVEEATLYLNVEAFSNKQIYRENCDISKRYDVRVLTHPWDPDAADYAFIREQEQNGETIGSFTAESGIPAGEYYPVMISPKRIMEGYGFTIVQQDESFCRLQFYSHAYRYESRRPYIVVDGGGG